MNGSEELFSLKTIPEQARETLAALTWDEQTQLLAHYIAEEKAGRITFRRPGRPRKGSTAFAMHELIGATRQFLCHAKKLAQVPEDDFKIGPRRGAYTMLVKAGQRRPVDAMDTFEGSEIGELAEQLLAPVERFLKQVPKRGQRFLSTIVPLIRCAEIKHQKVVWFGEMDALLCAEARMKAAIELERLGMNWFKHLPVTYAARYPMTEELKGEPYAAICAEHSAVLSAEA